MSLPLVSIITPSYNKAQFIEQTILSVLGQDYPNIEYWVVDGGSKDGTLDIIKKYDQRLKWVAEPDGGQSDALNKGYRWATGDIIGWINADDTYNPGAVRSAVHHLLSHPEAGAVFSHCNIIDESGRLVYKQVAPNFTLQGDLILHNVPQPTVFFRTAALQRVGFVCSNLHYIMDWELYLRLGKYYPLIRVEETWANFREYSFTKTSISPEKFWEEIIGVFDDFFKSADLPLNVLSVRAKAYARAYWNLGLAYHGTFTPDNHARGRESCRMAIDYFPLFENDYDYVAACFIDWAVRRITPHRVEEFTQEVLSIPCWSSEKQVKYTKRLNAHIMVGQMLASQEIQKDPNTFFNLISAIQADWRWLKNRGVLAVLLRSGLRRLVKRWRYD